MKETKRFREHRDLGLEVGQILPSGSCERKKRYNSQAEARRAADSLYFQEVYPMNAYRCKRCRGWHVGHRGVR